MPTQLLTGTASGQATATGSVHNARVWIPAQRLGRTAVTKWFVTIGVALAFAGTSAGTAAASGNLELVEVLAGTANGAGGASGQFTLAPESMGGTAAGVGGCAGYLSLTPLAVAGTATGVGGASGDLILGHLVGLAGTAAGVGGGSGRFALVLTGAANGVATASGQLNLTYGFSGAAHGVGGASGRLVLTYVFTGTANGVATASGNLGLLRRLAGTAAGVGGGSGDLTYWIDLAGTATGVASGSGDLEPVRPPVNDPFANPTDLTGDTGSVTLITVADTYQLDEPDPQVGTGSVWYTFTAPGDGTLHIGTGQTPAPAWQTRVEVYTGATIDTLEPEALGDLGSDPQTGVADSLTGGTDLMVTSGITYRIRVQDAGQGRFDGVLDWTFATVPVVTPSGNVTLEATTVTTYSLQLDAANLVPDQVLTFNVLDATSTDLGLLDDTVTADDSGGVHAASISIIPPTGPLPASGNYTLVVHASSDISLPFTLDLLEPDVPQPLPTAPAPVATLAVQRWVFQDVTPAADPASWTVPINPHDMTSPFGPKTLGEEGTVSPEGQSLIFEGRKQSVDWSFTGWVHDQTHHDNLVYWSELPYRIYIVDHYKRAWEVYIYDLDITPVRAIDKPWKHQYTMKARITRGPIQL